MKVTRRYLMELAGALLLIVWMGAVLSIASFNPQDPVLPLAIPVHPTPHNLLSYPGAWFAAQAYHYFGWSVLPLLAAWYLVAMFMLLRKVKSSWLIRITGAQLLIPSTALLAHLFQWPLSQQWYPLSGSGGILGESLFQIIPTSTSSNLVLSATIGVFVLGTALIFDWCWPLTWSFMRKSIAWFASRKQITPMSISTRPMKPASLAGKEALPDTIPIRHPDQPRKTGKAKANPALKIVTTDEEETDVTETNEQAALPTLPLKDMPFIKKFNSSPETPENKPLSEHASDEVWKQEGEYQLPPLNVLEEPEAPPYHQPEHEQRLRDRAAKLEQVFSDFGINVRVVGINTGPVITQFEIALETGLRLSRVTSLADDLALKLKVASVRVVAPLPNKDTVGIEIPNEVRSVVKLREVIMTAGNKLSKYKIPLFLGRDTEGQPLVYDLAEMPHLLIAGRTGTGKSVCMNTIVLSMLMTRRPDQVRMIMIDPKMLEMSEYGKVPHLMHPVVNNMKKAEAILSWAVDKMDERYEILMRAKVRSIAAYNELTPEEIYKRVKPVDDDEKARIPERMPYIVLFIDEFADLMMQNRKEVEGHIIRLAQKSRAAGIHLVIATQKPTVDVVTGLIKSNLPARICFQVASRTDSRVVLDEMGAEKLLGKGDMLFLQPGTSTIVRGQGTYASDRDIAHVVSYLETDQPAYARELIQLSTAGKKRMGSGEGGSSDLMEQLRERDELYPEAVELVIREQRGSVSLLQRALGIGYGRGARLIDFMAEDGFVGPYNGSNAREVLVKHEQWEAMKSGQMAEAS
ncbi:MAG: DNA translocase FtsK [Planctomycetia bacterium]|nr:DNA translocase FtsK [Planctomycetia bacterium]